MMSSSTSISSKADIEMPCISERILSYIYPFAFYSVIWNGVASA